MVTGGFVDVSGRSNNTPDLGGESRRGFITKVGVATAAAWTAPIVMSMQTPAAAATCCSPSSTATLAPACQTNTTTPLGVCTVFFDSNNNTPAPPTICRSSRTQQMLFSRDSAGTQEPYFDELGILTVTSPTSNVVTWNFIRWQADCRDPSAANDVTLTSPGNQQCSTTTVPAIDITSMFGNECGIFQLRLQVVNRYSPYGWSQAFIVPQ